MLYKISTVGTPCVVARQNLQNINSLRVGADIIRPRNYIFIGYAIE